MIMDLHITPPKIELCGVFYVKMSDYIRYLSVKYPVISLEQGTPQWVQVDLPDGRIASLPLGESISWVDDDPDMPELLNADDSIAHMATWPSS